MKQNHALSFKVTHKQIKTMRGYHVSYIRSSKVKKLHNILGQLAQLVRALSPHSKVVGSISIQGTYKNQPMNASVSGRTN